MSVPYDEFRDAGLISAMLDDPPLPRGRLIGRVFVMPTRLHLPGWQAPVTLCGVVPRLLGGIAATADYPAVPSWGSLEAHFTRRERRQNREAFK